MLRLTFKLNKIAILVFSSLLIVSPAYAGGFFDTVKQADPFNKNSEAGKATKDLDPTNKNSAVREAGRQLDAYRIEGMESASLVCNTVGYTKCIDPNFIQLYAALKTAANVGMFQGPGNLKADQCGGFVNTMVNTGKTGAQIYAAYNGIAVPPQVLEFGAAQYREHGNDSCKVMYGSPNPQNLVRTNVDGVPITVTQTDLPKYQDFDSQILDAEPVSNPSNNSSKIPEDSSSDINSMDDSAPESTETNPEPASDGFKVKW